MQSYCVKERKVTGNVPGSERYSQTKNNCTIMKCTCASCRITKCKFVKSHEGGSIGDALLSAGMKGLYEMGKVCTKYLLKSDTAETVASRYIKNMAGKMIDQGVDQTLDGLASNIHTVDGSGWLGTNSSITSQKQKKD